MVEDNERRDASAPRRVLSSLLREPLVHFLAIGGVLLGAYSLLDRAPEVEETSNEIALTVDSMAQLLMIFESQWKRQPTQGEFNAMIEDRIREEILYREALALGLDRDDTIVKRRMAQKMQFLAEGVAAQREPTTDELQTWFAGHTDLFKMPARISFRHLYFSLDKRGGSARDDAAKALAELKRKRALVGDDALTALLEETGCDAYLAPSRTAASPEMEPDDPDAEVGDDDEDEDAEN